jgi:hypothetical protein
MLEIHHPAFSCPLCRTFANLEEDVEIDAASFDLENDAAEKEAPAPVSALEDADMLLLSPNLGRERDGAETEVEPEMGIGSLRRIPVPPSIIDLAEESDDDRDALMVDLPNHDYEPPLPPLPEGEGLVPPPPPERDVPGTRSASVSDAEDASGDSAQGVDEADRAVKRKR